jgi:hypothetical protein
VPAKTAQLDGEQNSFHLQSLFHIHFVGGCKMLPFRSPRPLYIVR